MRLALFGLIALLLAACQDDANRVVVEAETPNGQAFYFMPIDERGVTDITIRMAWPHTWPYEDQRNQTDPYIATETILSGGTEDLAPQDILELFNDKNAYGFLTAASSHVYGELGFPKEHREAIVPIAAEMLARPQFDENWVNRIKRGFSSNQANAQLDTSFQMWSAARFAVLGDQPLTAFLNATGTISVDLDSVENLRTWHKTTITKDNAVIAVTGAIAKEDAGEVVDALLAGLPHAEPATVQIPKANFSPRIIHLHLPNAEKTTLGFLGQLPPTSEGGDVIDLVALSQYGGADGPLFTAIRTDLRASYGFQPGYSNYNRDNRILFIAGEVEGERLEEAIDVIKASYQAFLTDPDMTGFEELRSQMAEGTAENVDYVDVAAQTILEYALDGLDPSIAPKLGDQISAIEPDDVRNRLATAFPKADDLIILSAGPTVSSYEGVCVIEQIENAQDC